LARTPFERRLRVLERVVEGGAVDDRGQQRGLRGGELVRGGGEVALRGHLHAVGAVAEVDEVEVVLEDLVLAHLAFDRDRVPQLGDLAGDRLRGRRLLLGLVGARLQQQHVLHVLLGDRGPALGVAALRVPE
jgi:hypothetical protein